MKSAFNFRTALLVSVFIFSLVKAPAQIVLNEFSATNAAGIQDEDGDYEDWIEFYNKGLSSGNL